MLDAADREALVMGLSLADKGHRTMEQVWKVCLTARHAASSPDYVQIACVATVHMQRMRGILLVRGTACVENVIGIGCVHCQQESVHG